jgi:Sec-independent protein translocase protein TatA
MSIAELLIIALVVFLVRTPDQTRQLFQQLGRGFARARRHYDTLKTKWDTLWHD